MKIFSNSLGWILSLLVAGLTFALPSQDESGKRSWLIVIPEEPGLEPETFDIGLLAPGESRELVTAAGDTITLEQTEEGRRIELNGKLISQASSSQEGFQWIDGYSQHGAGGAHVQIHKYSTEDETVDAQHPRQHGSFFFYRGEDEDVRIHSLSSQDGPLLLLVER